MFLAQLAELFMYASQMLYVGVFVCVCLDVNQSRTSRKCCTRRLVILHAQTY